MTSSFSAYRGSENVLPFDWLLHEDSNLDNENQNLVSYL